MNLDIQIRWLIRRDMPEVLMIERGCFEFPWTDEDFMKTLQQKNCIGMIAEYDHEIVGFMVYELHKSRLHILNFAVKPVYQRCGIGRQMIERLVDKLSQQRRHEIWTEIRERNLAAQGFFKDMGFVALSVLRNRYEDTNEDCYLFFYALTEQRDELAEPSLPWQNRLWKWVGKEESERLRRDRKRQQ